MERKQGFKEYTNSQWSSLQFIAVHYDRFVETKGDAALSLKSIYLLE
jgi:hypothetical protein